MTLKISDNQQAYGRLS